MIAKSSFAAALAMVFAVSSVHAQTPGTVPLQLSADTPGAEFEVRAGKHSDPFKCSAPCTVWVYPGSYRVKMRGPFPSRSTTVSVDGPTRVDGEGGSSGTRTTGLVLGTAGAAAVVIGIGMLALSSMGEGTHRDDGKNTPWLVVMGVGAATSGVGWIMFGSAGSSLTTTGARPTFAVAPTKNGGAMALSWTF